MCHNPWTGASHSQAPPQPAPEPLHPAHGYPTSTDLLAQPLGCPRASPRGPIFTSCHSPLFLSVALKERVLCSPAGTPRPSLGTAPAWRPCLVPVCWLEARQRKELDPGTRQCQIQKLDEFGMSPNCPERRPLALWLLLSSRPELLQSPSTWADECFTEIFGGGTPRLYALGANTTAKPTEFGCRPSKLS